MEVTKHLHSLYREFGPSKLMGLSAPEYTKPHYFLHRSFLGEQDIAILFNTKRCRYQCKFCALPFKSSNNSISLEDILSQYLYVLSEVKHSLGVLERLTIANEGSVFDAETFDFNALLEIVRSTRVLPKIRKLVFETRLEFIDIHHLKEIKAVSHKKIDILTGFETYDEYIRDYILGKREELDSFLFGLDKLVEVQSDLTTYILFKPSPYMTDGEAITEAERSIDYVAKQCDKRGILFTIRLNPMYVSKETIWANLASKTPEYKPPRLSDVLELAHKKRHEGIKIYIGLTSEGLADTSGTYRVREDFSFNLLEQAIQFNFKG
jgi:archaeosine synthase beta-subunit